MGLTRTLGVLGVTLLAGTGTPQKGQRTLSIDFGYRAAVLFGGLFGLGGAIFPSLTRHPLGSPDVVGFHVGSSTVVMVLLGVALARVLRPSEGRFTWTGKQYTHARPSSWPVSWSCSPRRRWLPKAFGLRILSPAVGRHTSRCPISGGPLIATLCPRRWPPPAWRTSPHA